MTDNRSARSLPRRFSKLKARLTEVEDTLDAIRSGSVDALVVRTPRGEQLFTLRGADQTYRALVEAMNEGAVTLNRGLISFCNHPFARLARSPLEKIFGTPISNWIYSTEFRSLLKGLKNGAKQRASLEAILRAADGSEIPVLLSLSRFCSDGQTVVSLVVRDITEHKFAQRALQKMSHRRLEPGEGDVVALDLHDGVNQLLSAAKYRLNCSRHNPNAAFEIVEEARFLIEKAIAEVRLIGRNLRPSELDDLGLAAALRSLAHEFESRYRIPIHCRCSITSKLPTEVEMALYRIAQEALTNVAKHSHATRAELGIICSNNHAALNVRDNGKGFRVHQGVGKSPGWGLKNMKERAGLLWGTFSISSVARNKGTAVSVTIPLHTNGSSNGVMSLLS